MKPHPPTSRARSGFSLLELILALSMVAMLTLTLYMSLAVAIKARASATASLAPARDAAIAADLVAADLAAAMRPTGILAGAFTGTRQGGSAGADTLVFYAVGGDTDPGDDDPLAEGVRRIELAVRPDGPSPVLVRRVTRNLLATVTPEPEEELLCRGVRGVRLRYYDGSAWQDGWDSTALGSNLPAAVELTLEIERSTRGSGAPETLTVIRVVPLACTNPDSLATTGGAT